MANTTVTHSWVAFNVAERFANSLRGVGQFNREYNDEYRSRGGKIGDTVKVRLPQQWEVTTGDSLSEQNIQDETVNVILNRRRHIGMAWSTQEQTTDLEAIKERYIMPAGDTLASVYDQLSMQDVYKSVYNSVGTLGTTPSAALTYMQATTKILDLAGPDENLVAVLDPLAEVTLANATFSLFNTAGKGDTNYRRGQIANDQLGISRWFRDQNIPRFTSGEATSASSPRVNGASQTGSSIVTDGWGSGASNLNEGDIVTFAGVYAVNPLSKESTGRLQQFTLTADVSDSSGAATLSISPSIITTGAKQNVTGSPANNAVITFWGMSDGGTQSETVSPQNLVFHPSAFASVMADLAMPSGGANGSRVSSRDLNIALRFVEQYDIDRDKNVSRLDILFGAAAVREENACRVVG